MRRTGILLKDLRGLPVKKSISIGSSSGPRAHFISHLLGHSVRLVPLGALQETLHKMLSLAIQFTPFPSWQSLPGWPPFMPLLVLHEGTTFYFPRIFLTFLIS